MCFSNFLFFKLLKISFIPELLQLISGECIEGEEDLEDENKDHMENGKAKRTKRLKSKKSKAMPGNDTKGAADSEAVEGTCNEGTKISELKTSIKGGQVGNQADKAEQVAAPSNEAGEQPKKVQGKAKTKKAKKSKVKSSELIHDQDDIPSDKATIPPQTEDGAPDALVHDQDDSTKATIAPQVKDSESYVLTNTAKNMSIDDIWDGR